MTNQGRDSVLAAIVRILPLVAACFLLACNEEMVEPTSTPAVTATPTPTPESITTGSAPRYMGIPQNAEPEWQYDDAGLRAHLSSLWKYADIVLDCSSGELEAYIDIYSFIPDPDHLHASMILDGDQSGWPPGELWARSAGPRSPRMHPPDAEAFLHTIYVSWAMIIDFGPPYAVIYGHAFNVRGLEVDRLPCVDVASLPALPTPTPAPVLTPRDTMEIPPDAPVEWHYAASGRRAHVSSLWDAADLVVECLGEHLQVYVLMYAWSPDPGLDPVPGALRLNNGSEWSPTEYPWSRSLGDSTVPGDRMYAWFPVVSVLGAIYRSWAVHVLFGEPPFSDLDGYAFNVRGLDLDRLSCVDKDSLPPPP